MKHLSRLTGLAAFTLICLAVLNAVDASATPLKTGTPGAGGTAKGGDVCNNSIVLDSSFESGSPNNFWIEFDSEVGSPLCDGGCSNSFSANTGAWWAWFGGLQNVDYRGSLYQEVTLPSADSALITFAVAVPSAMAGTEFYVVVDSNVVGSLDETDADRFPDFTLVEVDISEYADGLTHEIGFELFYPLGSFASVFVDDVCVNVSNGNSNPDLIGTETSDIGGTVASAGPVLPANGGRFAASINPESDNDVFAFDAIANTTYIVETFAPPNGGGTAVLDTVLSILSGNSALLAYDDDGGGGLFSRIVWTAPSTGRYFIEVASFAAFYTGSYTVSVSLSGGTTPPIGGSFTLYVDPVGGFDSPSTTGSANDPFRTITAALARVESEPNYRDAVLFLEAGIYEETVKLIRDVTLMGADPANPGITVIRPSLQQLGAAPGQIYVVGAENAALFDLAIDRPILNPGDLPAGIKHLVIPTVSMQVSNVQFTGNNQRGSQAIEVFGSQNTDVLIDRCTFRNFDNAIDALDSDAIITNCEFMDIRDDAVFIDAPKSRKQGLPPAVPNMGIEGLDGSGRNRFRCDSILGMSIVNTAGSTMSAQLNDFCGTTNENEIRAVVQGDVEFCPVLVNGLIQACTDGDSPKAGSGCAGRPRSPRSALPDLAVALCVVAVLTGTSRQRSRQAVAQGRPQP